MCVQMVLLGRSIGACQQIRRDFTSTAFAVLRLMISSNFAGVCNRQVTPFHFS
jgi:hypothetical protein